MKRIVGRFLLLLFAGLAMAIGDNIGWVDKLVSTAAGLLLYWLYVVGCFLFMVFGVVIPWLAYLRTHDSKFARFMTGLLPSKRH